MIRFPTQADFAAAPNFSGEEALRGVPPSQTFTPRPGLLRVEVDGSPEDVCFYGRHGAANVAPLIYLDGDTFQTVNGVLSAFPEYSQMSPLSVQAWAEQISIALDSTFIALARPGVGGSSGDHRQRRRPREGVIVDKALDALKTAFDWKLLDLAGLSGGGHVIAVLMARRQDIGAAIIASGNVSIRQRNAMIGWTTDVIGFADFVDPIDLAERVAAHPPQRVVVLTDPEDRIVPAACQSAYVAALRNAGVGVQHRLMTALDPGRHVLRDAALLAAAALGTRV